MSFYHCAGLRAQLEIDHQEETNRYTNPLLAATDDSSYSTFSHRFYEQ